MSKITGTVLASAGVPLGNNPTHYDSFGQGGYQTVETLAQRDAIVASDELDPDGISSGRRKVNMLVSVLEDANIYQLKISNYLSLDVTARLAALADNANWVEFSVGGGSGGNGNPNTFKFWGMYSAAEAGLYAIGDFIVNDGVLWQLHSFAEGSLPEPKAHDQYTLNFYTPVVESGAIQPWVADTRYNANTIVLHNGALYYVSAADIIYAHLNDAPDVSPAWSLLTSGGGGGVTIETILGSNSETAVPSISLIESLEVIKQEQFDELTARLDEIIIPFSGTSEFPFPCETNRYYSKDAVLYKCVQGGEYADVTSGAFFKVFGLRNLGIIPQGLSPQHAPGDVYLCPDNGKMYITQTTGQLNYRSSNWQVIINNAIANGTLKEYNGLVTTDYLNYAIANLSGGGGGGVTQAQLDAEIAARIAGDSGTLPFVLRDTSGLGIGSGYETPETAFAAWADARGSLLTVYLDYVEMHNATTLDISANIEYGGLGRSYLELRNSLDCEFSAIIKGFELNASGPTRPDYISMHQGELNNCALNLALRVGTYATNQPASIYLIDTNVNYNNSLPSTDWIFRGNEQMTGTINVYLQGTTTLHPSVTTPAYINLIDERGGTGDGNSVTVEQTLTSNSVTAVPSVAAVKSVVDTKANLGIANTFTREQSIIPSTGTAALYVHGTTRMGRSNQDDGNLTVANRIDIVPGGGGQSRLNINNGNASSTAEFHLTASGGNDWAFISGGNNVAGGGGTAVVEGNFLLTQNNITRAIWNKNTGGYTIGNRLSPASALFDVQSTTHGSLPAPRMTEAQRLAIGSPAIGLEVYQTNGVEGKYVYTSTGWRMYAFA